MARASSKATQVNSRLKFVTNMETSDWLLILQKEFPWRKIVQAPLRFLSKFLGKKEV
jgi:hypothetical protein